MREICQSGSEGGVALTCHSYPYRQIENLRYFGCGFAAPY
jgi:hypothetical protein